MLFQNGGRRHLEFCEKKILKENLFLRRHFETGVPVKNLAQIDATVTELQPLQ